MCSSPGTIYRVLPDTPVYDTSPEEASLKDLRRFRLADFKFVMCIASVLEHEYAMYLLPGSRFGWISHHDICECTT